MSLSDQMVEQIEGSKTNDYHQRSAIGMARSWVESGELKLAANSADLKPNRDKLAADLVAVMEGASPEACVVALSDARKHVNAPYQLEIRGGERIGKPKEQKKARESEK